MNSNPPDLSEPQTIDFGNGRQAALVTIEGTSDPLEALRRLGIPSPNAVVVLSGGAGTVGESQLRRLAPYFSLGIARAAKERRAAIIDGGTQAGVMMLMGKGVSDQDFPIPLLGIAPSETVTYPGSGKDEKAPDLASLDANHSHFALVRGNTWGDETAVMYNLAEALHLGKLGEGRPLPTITLLAAARVKSVALNEALATVRKGWTLVVLEGSGQLPDEIARRWRNRRTSGGLRGGWGRLGIATRRWLNRDLQEADAFIDEIVDNGQIVIFSMRGKPSDLERLLVSELKEKPKDSVLVRAWKRFAVYELNAAGHQKTYRFLKTWPLILGVLATALILIQEFLTNNKLILEGDLWHQLLRVLIILVPIVVSLFLAADRLFKSGNKWRLLRYYAEEIKTDIYSYRVLSTLQPLQESYLPDQAGELSNSLTDIGKRLMRTEANESALKPYNGPIPPKMYGAAAKDDGLGPLNPEDYVKIRISDQLNFYAMRANQLQKQLQPRQWLILIFGAVGSLLAALGGAFQFWVPLTVAMVSALTAYLEYQQVEQTIIKYNQAMTKLENLSDEWAAMTEGDKKDPKTILRVVQEVEAVMQSEHLGWVQQMQTSQTSAVKGEGEKATEEGNEEGEPAPQRGGTTPVK